MSFIYCFSFLLNYRLLLRVKFLFSSLRKVLLTSKQESISAELESRFFLLWLWLSKNSLSGWVTSLLIFLVMRSNFFANSFIRSIISLLKKTMPWSSSSSILSFWNSWRHSKDRDWLKFDKRELRFLASYSISSTRFWFLLTSSSRMLWKSVASFINNSVIPKKILSHIHIKIN